MCQGPIQNSYSNSMEHKEKKEPFGGGEKFRLKQGSIYEKLNEDSWTLDSTCQNK